MNEEVKVHEDGLVRLLDIMGSDEDIVDAARISYGKGTKKVSETRNLIRYLMRHKHTSPFEMCEVKFYLKLPIFVMRQIVRHRTANLNEYSGRYSLMSEDFYVPHDDDIQKQSTQNNQGRGEEIEQKGLHPTYMLSLHAILSRGLYVLRGAIQTIQTFNSVNMLWEILNHG